eukprot:CAMPEP_0175169330 /NCGR_PEP_ID=MMETSP0087-20121206/29513_1 /TAXON_ID=136419 /ORGANISM="Unknown Unknown, Strain D1" /LENGTH=46 /DNA_ID= /DNA_START= /DNA_END= /DNA_ORIENTATION=
MNLLVLLLPCLIGLAAAKPTPAPPSRMGSVLLGAYPGYKPGIITKG